MAVKTLTGNPIVVGSGDTFTTTQDKVRIQGAFWDIGAGAAADTVVIKHGDGTTLIWSATLVAGGLNCQGFFLNKPLVANGLAITPPTHGTLYVYLADGLT